MKLVVFNFSLRVFQAWDTGLTMTCRKAYRKRMHPGCMTNLASSLCDRFGKGSPSSKTSIKACVDRFIHSFLWKILAPGTQRGIFIPEKYRGTPIYVLRQMLCWVEHRRLVPRITKSIDWRAITWDNVGRVQCVRVEGARGSKETGTNLLVSLSACQSGQGVQVWMYKDPSSRVI